jgi:hypothetical protein
MYTRCLIAVASAALLLQVTQATANIRPPHRLENGPSSSLRAPAEGLTVQSETLRFDFAETMASVTAEYTVHSEQAGTHVFDFVLPAQLGRDGQGMRLMSATEFAISAAVNRNPAEVQPVQLLSEQDGFDQELDTFIKAYYQDEEIRMLMLFDQKLGRRVEAPEASWQQSMPGRVQHLVAEAAARMVVARFSGTLQAGENILRVAYQQPLERMEYDYGYFRDGRYVGAASYELSPLKGWQLAEDFQLEVELTAHTSGWFRKLRGRATAIALCRSDGEEVPGTRQSEDGRQSLTAVFGRDFPARLKACFGDADIIRHGRHYAMPNGREAADALAAFLMRER